MQVSPTHFAFIWMGGGYTCWEDFVGETEELWLKYRAVASPNSVDRIGVRFVNVIPMPTTPVEIRDYLRISIDIPAALPQTLANMFTQVDIPMDEYEALATISSAISAATPEMPGGGLLLDIDVKSPVTITTVDESFSGVIGSKLDRLRLAKNLVFEACITDATRERID